MMKIACYTNSMDGSGARRVFFEFVKRLSEKNISIDMYHLSGTPLKKFPFRDCAAQVYTYELEQYREWRVQPWLFSVILNFFKKLLYLRKLKKVSRQMSADMNQRGYDMAFFDVCNLLRASYHFRFTDIPSVLYLHHPKREAFEPALFYGDIFSAQGKSTFVKMYKKLSAFLQYADDMLLGRISRTNTRHADLVLTNSCYTREYIYKVYSILAKVVYPGIDSNAFKPDSSIRKNFLLSVGGIEENKGFKDIVRAIALIPREKRPYLVIVAGRRQPRIYEELVYLGKEKM
ncbi:MAG: glycosyltransferase [Desulfobacterales bacterium]